MTYAKANKELPTPHLKTVHGLKTEQKVGQRIQRVPWSRVVLPGSKPFIGCELDDLACQAVHQASPFSRWTKLCSRGTKEHENSNRPSRKSYQIYNSSSVSTISQPRVLSFSRVKISAQPTTKLTLQISRNTKPKNTNTFHALAAEQCIIALFLPSTTFDWRRASSHFLIQWIHVHMTVFTVPFPPSGVSRHCENPCCS